MSNIREKVQQFYTLILKGDDESLEDYFYDEPRINTPQHGEVVGREAFTAYVKDRQQWLNAHHTSCDIVSVLVTDQRIVVEVKLLLSLKEPTESDLVELPISVIADIKDEKIAYLRSYHSSIPIMGESHIRKPMLKVANTIEVPTVIRRYLNALKQGSEQEILSLFNENGYVREPSGEAFKHQGKDERAIFYHNTFLQGGGVQLKECTTTFDGKKLAVEYICDQWGTHALEAQAGMVVYELGANHKINAVRIYDDIAA